MHFTGFFQRKQNDRKSSVRNPHIKKPAKKMQTKSLWSIGRVQSHHSTIPHLSHRTMYTIFLWGSFIARAIHFATYLRWEHCSHFSPSTTRTHRDTSLTFSFIADRKWHARSLIKTFLSKKKSGIKQFNSPFLLAIGSRNFFFSWLSQTPFTETRRMLSLFFKRWRYVPYTVMARV